MVQLSRLSKWQYTKTLSTAYILVTNTLATILPQFIWTWQYFSRHQRLRSSTGIFSTTRYRLSTFRFCCQSVCNSLPDYLRASDCSTDSFRRLL